MTIRLLQLRVGAVRQMEGWRSAIFKEVITQPCWLSSTGLGGDAVGDTVHHGGPEQAVLAYAESHYAAWKAEGFMDTRGAFGENLLLEGLDDQEACIGDRFALGGTELQISCARVPCATLAKRHGRKDVVDRVFETGRGGWYFRVLKEGILAPGDELILRARPNPGWTVMRALQARWRKATDPAEARALAALPELNPSWPPKLLG
ncbi:MAG: MOSC domain-containing protein [Acidobacteria bacterium]|nr:MOSC domain-containing protein [Acidobacteriota bacterium]